MKRYSLLIAATLLIAFLLTLIFWPRLEFQDLVTEQVIKVAVANFATELKGPGYNDWPYHFRNGIAYSAGNHARHAVYQSEFGPDWFKTLYASQSYNAATDSATRRYWENQGGKEAIFQKYLKIMEVARQSLDSSEELRNWFNRFKPVILEAIRENQIEEDVAFYLETYRWILNEPIPASQFQLLMIYREALGTDNHSLLQRLQEENNITTADNYLYEWRLRREREGGTALVTAWSWAIDQMIISLKYQQ